MIGNKSLLFACLLLISIVTSAQDYRADLSLRGWWSTMPADNFTSNIAGFRLQANYLISKNFSVGLAYSRSDFFGDEVLLSEGDIDDGSSNDLNLIPKSQGFGIVAQIGTDRNKGARLYGIFEGFYSELVHEIAPEQSGAEETITIANSGFTFGAGIGFSVKLGRALSFNILEAKANYYNKSFDYYGDEPLYQFQVESGLSYKILRKK